VAFREAEVRAEKQPENNTSSMIVLPLLPGLTANDPGTFAHLHDDIDVEIVEDKYVSIKVPGEW
jgi:hypothetical protein